MTSRKLWPVSDRATWRGHGQRPARAGSCLFAEPQGSYSLTPWEVYAVWRNRQMRVPSTLALLTVSGVVP